MKYPSTLCERNLPKYLVTLQPQTSSKIIQFREIHWRAITMSGLSLFLLREQCSVRFVERAVICPWRPLARHRGRKLGSYHSWHTGRHMDKIAKGAFCERPLDII